MANPTPYERTYSFTDFQARDPSAPLPGIQVDNELENIETSLSKTIDAIKDVRRSDGALANGIVTFDSLNNDLKAEYTGGAVSAWAPVVDYSAGLAAQALAPATTVFYNGETYVCVVAHTTTATFIPGNWKKIAAKGASGVGAGDMLAANNLSDLADTAQALANLDLDNVDNTSDIDKPVSTATQTALNQKASVEQLALKANTGEVATALASKFDKVQPNANAVSASVMDIGSTTNPSIYITGANPITFLGVAPVGTIKYLLFEGGSTLVQGGTTFLLPGQANIVTGNLDTCTVKMLDTGQWLVISYQRGDGTALKGAQKIYTSPDTAYANGTLVSFAHGLGVVPTDFSVDFVCVTAEAGYSVGDVVRPYTQDVAANNGTVYGFYNWRTATTIGIFPIGGGIPMMNRTNNQLNAMSPANWRMRVRATA